MEALTSLFASPQTFEAIQYTTYEGSEFGTVKLRTVTEGDEVSGLKYRGRQITLYAKGVTGIKLGDKITIDPNAFVYKVEPFATDDGEYDLKWIYPKG